MKSVIEEIKSLNLLKLLRYYKDFINIPLTNLVERKKKIPIYTSIISKVLRYLIFRGFL